MRKLEVNQMENLSGGLTGCQQNLIALGITFVGAFWVTTPIGAGLFAASFIWGSATTGC